MNKGVSSPLSSSHKRVAAPLAVRQEIRVNASTKEEEPIYIGFKKGDYAPREGRQGRVIMDNPSKYPTRDELTGGWAGGEAALVVQREEFKKELLANKTAPGKPSGPKGNKSSIGPDAIYVGFGKDELDIKAAGIKGRVIYDDISKYPSREDGLGGLLMGLTGGFAGGERGLRGFVETGEVKIRKADEPGGQGISPLQVAFLILFSSGAVGTLLLSQIYDATESPAVRMEQLKLQAVSVAGSETLLISLATGFAILAVVAGGRVLISSLDSKNGKDFSK